MARQKSLEGGAVSRNVRAVDWRATRSARSTISAPNRIVDISQSASNSHKLTLRLWFAPEDATLAAKGNERRRPGLDRNQLLIDKAAAINLERKHAQNARNVGHVLLWNIDTVGEDEVDKPDHGAPRPQGLPLPVHGGELPFVLLLSA